MHGCTLIKERSVTDWTSCLMNTWLVGGPSLLKPPRCCASLDLNEPRCFCAGDRARFAQVEIARKNVSELSLRGKERDRGACRLTVCQTTRSAHPRRGVGFLIEYSYLKPRSLFCGCERDRKVGPDRDSVSTWPMYRFDELHRLNESVTTCSVSVTAGRSCQTDKKMNK